MDKETLKDYYNELDQMHREFILADQEYRSGKNSEKRKNGKRRIDNILYRFESYVMNSPGLFDYLVGTQGNDIDKAFQWDDMKSSEWFDRDIFRVLEKMKQDIGN